MRTAILSESYRNRSTPLSNERDRGLLVAAQDRLNEYCRAVNEPIGSTGETPCSGYGKLLEAQGQLNGRSAEDRRPAPFPPAKPTDRN
jgi:hypothetical protein